jgi:uncharacterized protein YutE (UPF0331/DUF86 family)
MYAGHALADRQRRHRRAQLQRATQAAIDLAGHIVATESYGLPADFADAYNLLERQGVVDSTLAVRLRKMVGFRNIAVYQYEAFDPKIIDVNVAWHLDDLRAFGTAVLAHGSGTP